MASVALAGLRERGHGAAILGDERASFDRAKADSLVVRSSWAAMLLVGASFVNDHGTLCVGDTTRTAIDCGVAYGVAGAARAAGVARLALVAVGALLALFALARYVFASGG